MRARRAPARGAHSMSLEEKGSRFLQTAEARELFCVLIFLRRYAVDARRPILAGPYVGFSRPFEIDDMVQREQHRSRLLPRQFDMVIPLSCPPDAR